MDMRTWRNITGEDFQGANESRVELRGEVYHFALVILGERKVHRG